MTDRRQTQPIDKGHEDPVTQYSESFRNRMVEKLTGPHAKSATALSTEVGGSQATLSRGKREADTVEQTMSPPDDGKPAPVPTKRPQDWTAEEKWALVTEAAAVPETELGAFLRRKGVHEAQLTEGRGGGGGGGRAPA